MEHLKSIPGAVSYGQYHLFRFQILFFLRIPAADPYSFNPTAFQLQSRRLCFKIHFSSEVQNFFPYMRHNVSEQDCSQMRLLHIQNLLRSPCFYENLHHLPISSGRILDLSV